MEIIVNSEEKTVILIDPTLEEMAEFLYENEEAFGDFKIITEWSVNS